MGQNRAGRDVKGLDRKVKNKAKRERTVKNEMVRDGAGWDRKEWMVFIGTGQ